MQVSLSAEELGKAPAEVQAWFLGRMGFGAKLVTVVKRGELKPAPVEVEEPKPTPTEVEEPKPTPTEVEEPKPTEDKTPSETTAEVLLERAVKFVEAKGQAALIPILKRMGIPNVKGCPPEKRAALLSEMAVHG